MPEAIKICIHTSIGTTRSACRILHILVVLVVVDVTPLCIKTLRKGRRGRRFRHEPPRFASLPHTMRHLLLGQPLNGARSRVLEQPS